MSEEPRWDGDTGGRTEASPVELARLTTPPSDPLGAFIQLSVPGGNVWSSVPTNINPIQAQAHPI